MLIKQSHMFMSQQNVWQNQNIIIDNKSFKTSVKFKHLGLILINQNYIHEKINSTSNWLMFANNHFRIFCLPTWYLKNINIKIFCTMILFMCVCVCVCVKCGLLHKGITYAAESKCNSRLEKSSTLRSFVNYNEHKILLG